MDWSSIIVAGMTTLAGGGIGSLLTAKIRRKREEFGVWQEQLKQMHELLQNERERNTELAKDRANMRDSYEANIADKTGRIREVQEREYQANTKLGEAQERIIRLTVEIADLKQELDNDRCVLHSCCDRQPENKHSRRAKQLKSIAEKSNVQA